MENEFYLLEDEGFGIIDQDLFWEEMPLDSNGNARDGIFIESNAPINRIKAVTTEPDFLWDGWFNLINARPMPTYSVPGLVDHF